MLQQFKSCAVTYEELG